VVGVIGDGDDVVEGVCGWGLPAWAVISVEL